MPSTAEVWITEMMVLHSPYQLQWSSRIGCAGSLKSIARPVLNPVHHYQNEWNVLTRVTIALAQLVRPNDRRIV